MNYYHKYLKYKKKYLLLVQKGGTVSTNTYHLNRISSLYYSESYLYTHDYKKNSDSDINFFTVHEYTLNTEDIENLEEQILTTPTYNEELPYTYKPEIIINKNDKIPYFSIYSRAFKRYVFYKITEWFETTVNKYYDTNDKCMMQVKNNGFSVTHDIIKTTFQISFSPTFNYKKEGIDLNNINDTISERWEHFYMIKKLYDSKSKNLSLAFCGFNKVQYPWKNEDEKIGYYIQHEDKNFAEIEKNKSLGIKVHLIVKFKYLFWMLEKIITNKNIFFIDNMPLFNSCKFSIDFPQSLLPNIFITEHQQEILYDANIVFYLYDTEQAKTLIKILKDMFPDKLNISSNKIPRFNIRITDTIYLGLGEGSHKEDHIRANDHNEKYDTFDEYKEILENCKLQETKVDCEKLNFLSSKISDHNLCIFTDSKCTVNKLNSYNFLTNKQYNSLSILMKELDVEMPSNVKI